MQGINFIFSIAILILSVVAHEVSHGFVAYLLGDNTAKRAGRLSMNPLKHLDMTGSFIVPLMLILLKSSFVFGWVKPVPYNPYNLKNQKWGRAWWPFRAVVQLFNRRSFQFGCFISSA